MLFHRWITFRKFTSGDEAAKWQEAFEREGIRYKRTPHQSLCDSFPSKGKP